MLSIEKDMVSQAFMPRSFCLKKLYIYSISIDGQYRVLCFSNFPENNSPDRMKGTALTSAAVIIVIFAADSSGLLVGHIVAGKKRRKMLAHHDGCPNALSQSLLPLLLRWSWAWWGSGRSRMQRLSGKWWGQSTRWSWKGCIRLHHIADKTASDVHLVGFVYVWKVPVAKVNVIL